jgi:hypothetical protein
MKLSASVHGADAIGRRLAALADAAATAAADAATEVLFQELERVRRREGFAPLVRDGAGTRRRIAAPDPVAIAREEGTLEEPAAPWLAPVLPGARRPMRAAALAAVARTISRRR